MIFSIAHRGNLYGIDKSSENNPCYVEHAIMEGYDAEVDVWFGNSNWWLGHDYPKYKTDLDFLKSYQDNLWMHCKDVQTFWSLLALNRSSKKFKANCFIHDKDIMALTTSNYLWTYNNGKLTNISIAVMPEHPCNNWSIEDIRDCAGVCTDHPAHWKELLS